jgi:hypothetical protein
MEIKTVLSTAIIVIVLMLTMVAGCIQDQPCAATTQVVATPTPMLVAEQKMGITISPQNPVTEVNSAIRFVVVYDNDYSPNSVSWSVTGPATIDGGGRFEAKGPGSAVVTATVGQASISTTVNINSPVYRYSGYSGTHRYRGNYHSNGCRYCEDDGYDHRKWEDDDHDNNGGTVAPAAARGDCYFLGKC